MLRGRADPQSTRSCGRPTGLGAHTHQFHDQSTTRRDAISARTLYLSRDDSLTRRCFTRLYYVVVAGVVFSAALDVPPPGANSNSLSAHRSTGWPAVQFDSGRKSVVGAVRRRVRLITSTSPVSAGLRWVQLILTHLVWPQQPENPPGRPS